MGLMAWEKHETLAAEQRGEAANLRLMAELQTAARSGMSIDLSHFERLDVVVPDNIGVIATRMPDGSLQLCPSLGEGSSPDQLQKRWAQIDMSANGGVLRIDNRVVLLDETRLAGIRNVLANTRIPADKVAEFIATPHRLFECGPGQPRGRFFHSCRRCWPTTAHGFWWPRYPTKRLVCPGCSPLPT